MAGGVRSRRLKKGLRWQYYGYYKGDKFHSHFKYYNEPDALVARRKHLERLATRGTVTMKLGDVIRMRIEELELKYSRQHAVTTETYLQKAEDKWGFHTPLINISRDMVQSILNADARRSKAKGCGNYSVNQFRSALHALFEWAIDRYELDYKNPVSKIKRYPIKSVDRYVPETWEIDVVERNLRPNQRLLFLFVKETGCRIGEALKVQVKDLNFKTNRVALRSNKFTGFSETKRLIPIPDMMAEVKLPSSPKARIFKSWTVNPTFLRNTIRRINKESVDSPELSYWQGLMDDEPEQITEFPWHSLRHLACSTWLSNNVSYIEVMYRLGHRNLKVTMNYCHSLGFTDFTESEKEYDF